ncbi:protein S100-A1-like [Salarias fasciatus]|uniref:Protein S100-A1-like n=1 Tax=Salarias fasciatus TaxID=181472 RepID=A0A672F8T1_SALFA|nr:protein S100-A1-like [Salarias fasciatus]XP_029959040.1 protein S100-A1-like [Salarias fasciatus]
MAGLDEVITNLVGVFLKYAGDDGGKKPKIKQDDVKGMLEQEILSPELKAVIDADEIEEATKVMDKNDDGEVNFHEYCRCVTKLAKTYYINKTGRGDKKGKKKEQK